MARKIHVQLIDDISGEDAQETLRFFLDGAAIHSSTFTPHGGVAVPLKPGSGLSTPEGVGRNRHNPPA